jgi:hypothetical protein
MSSFLLSRLVGKVPFPLYLSLPGSAFAILARPGRIAGDRRFSLQGYRFRAIYQLRLCPDQLVPSPTANLAARCFVADLQNARQPFRCTDCGRRFTGLMTESC